MKVETVRSIVSTDLHKHLYTDAVFAVGGRNYTRQQMIAELGCANFIAATRLGKVLRRLGIKTVQKLAQTDPLSLVRVQGVGERTVYVAMCLLDAHGYSVAKWWGWDRTKPGKLSTHVAKTARRESKRKHAA